MVRMTFTKKEIIKAIETEPLPLETGRWMKFKDDKETYEPNVTNKDKDVCAVCAVGAILRKRPETFLFSDSYGSTIDGLDVTTFVNTRCDYSCGDSLILMDTLKKNKFLNALSAFFEKQANDEYFYMQFGLRYDVSMGTKLKNKLFNERQSAIRAELINFVEAFFPEQFTVNQYGEYSNVKW